MSIERTKNEAILDLLFHRKNHQLHQIFYRRLRWVATIISIVGGSTAVVGILNRWSWAVAVSGFLVAVASALDVASQWSDKGAKHAGWQRDIGEILARKNYLSLLALDSSIDRHDAKVDDDVEAIKLIAFNRNARSAGREDLIRQLPFRARLYALLV